MQRPRPISLSFDWAAEKRQIFVHLRMKTLSCQYVFSPFFLKCIQFRCIKTNLGGERLLSQGRLGTKIHTCFQSWRFHTSFHAKRNMEVLLRKSWNSKKQSKPIFFVKCTKKYLSICQTNENGFQPRGKPGANCGNVQNWAFSKQVRKIITSQ